MEAVLSTSALAPEEVLGRGGPITHTADRRPMKTLEVRCLGGFQVHIAGRRIDHWRSNKARFVLKYLTTRGRRAAPKDILMEALWPECDPLHANDSLKAAVHTLREAMRSSSDIAKDFSWILCRNGSYLITPEAELWVDVEEFEASWQTARRLEKEARLDEAIAEFESAEALYEGDYLEDDLYEDWTLLRREGLKDIYLAILGRLADHSLQTADYHGCIAYCQKILLKDRCREDAYQRLMCCHNRLGQRNRAVAWYRLCEATIRGELGILPSHHTVRLHQTLLDDGYI